MGWRAHDRMVERGRVCRSDRRIEAAKRAGFQVCTNTTVYKETDIHELAVLFEYLTQLDVDGLMISPAYGYEAVRETNPDNAEQLFMTREEIQAKFRQARQLLGGFRLVTSPIYLEFLCGERPLGCAAWANPTRNVRGWKGPCYLITDAHYSTYRELVEATAWDAWPARPSLQPAATGFEPAAVLSANRLATCPHGRLADDVGERMKDEG